MRVRHYGSGSRFGASPLDVFSGGSLLASLASFYDTMEVRTSVTPPAIVNLKSALDPNSPPSPVAQFLQPTIILSGPAGQQTIAPYGTAGDGTAASIAIVGLLMALGYAIGWTARKRKHPGLGA